MSEDGRRFGNADARTFARRAFLGGVLFSALSIPFAGRLSRPYFTLLDQLGSPEAEGIFHEMFGKRESTQSASLLLGRTDYSAGFHPDNFAAGAALRRPLGFTNPEPDYSDPLDAARQDDLVVVGGTNSNVLTMVAWEASGPNMDRLSRPEELGRKPIIPLRWFGSSDRNSDEVKSLRPVGWKMEGQGYVSTVNWIVRDTVTGKSIWASSLDGPDKDRSGNTTHQLTSNHLYVTRLPNFLHPEFGEFDRGNMPNMTFFQGMHGLGTRGIELLLTGEGRHALAAARTAVKDSRAYQLLFEVGDVRELPDG